MQQNVIAKLHLNNGLTITINHHYEFSFKIFVNDDL